MNKYDDLNQKDLFDPDRIWAAEESGKEEEDGDSFVGVLKSFDRDKNRDLHKFVESGQEGAEPDPPMKYGQTVRGSSIDRFCPRKEVLKILENKTTFMQISAKLRRIFSVGRVYETYLRDRVLGDRKLTIGRWQCVACGFIPDEMGGAVRYPKPDVCQRCDSKQPRQAAVDYKELYDGELTPNLFRYVEETVSDSDSHVGGHVDAFLYWNRDYYILEIKTANNRRFREVVRSGPFQDHVAQTQTYMRLTGYKKAIIWYFNKDTADEKLVYLDYDSKLSGFMVAKGYKMNDYHQRGIIPDRYLCPNAGCKRAKGCDLVELCFSDKHPPAPPSEVFGDVSEGSGT